MFWNVSLTNRPGASLVEFDLTAHIHGHNHPQVCHLQLSKTGMEPCETSFSIPNPSFTI